jgi:hypothetical protein
MSQPFVDLTALDPVDLQALRLGAQVMGYKAGLAERPRVVLFFTALRAGVDIELARRGRPVQTAPVPLPPHVPAGVTVEAIPADDRRVVGEYLELLGANSRLSPAVREACIGLRNSLDADPPDDVRAG